MMREPIKWHDARTDPPRRGERVIARCYGFTGEAYLGVAGKWYRPNGMSWDKNFEQPVLEWAEMPATLPRV